MKRKDVNAAMAQEAFNLFSPLSCILSLGGRGEKGVLAAGCEESSDTLSGFHITV